MLISIYTDGACSGNGYAGATAGYGVLFVSDEIKIKSISKRLKCERQTNQRAELYAVKAALKRIYWMFDTYSNMHLHFYIDNTNALNTLVTERKFGDHKDLIDKINNLKRILRERGCTVTGEWIQAHQKVPNNNTLADELACRGKMKPKRKN